MRRILIDSGILLSYYQQQEPLHQAVLAFFDQNAAQLITSPICIAEVLWLLGDPSDRTRWPVTSSLIRVPITPGRYVGAGETGCDDCP